MTESARLELFQMINESYTDAYKEKNRKDEQLEVSVEWKEAKRLKNFNL